jgi:hypothetical protein
MKVEDETIYDCSKFCIEAGFDHLNLNSLVQFCEKTKLPQKLIDFKPVKVEVTPVGGLKTFLGKLNFGPVLNENTSNLVEEEELKEVGSSLLPILEFMRCLINPNEDGRVLRVKKVLSSASYFKYILLNPGSLFKDFVNQARYQDLTFKVARFNSISNFARLISELLLWLAEQCNLTANFSFSFLVLLVLHKAGL